jgi:Adenylate cyclase, family 3 (some proteins contain HAMP domain)
MQRKRVLVAFGDIRSFTSYTRRAMNSPEEKERVIDAVYNEFEKLAKQNPTYSVKYTGDGFMALVELGTNGTNPRHKVVIDFLRAVYVESILIVNLLQTMVGNDLFFRVRCTNGFAFKKMMFERNMGGRLGRRRVPEYVDYPISLADRLLEVYADQHLCVFHSSVKKLLGEKIDGMKITPLPPPTVCPLGVDQEDIEELFAFEFDLDPLPRKA